MKSKSSSERSETETGFMGAIRLATGEKVIISFISLLPPLRAKAYFYTKIELFEDFLIFCYFIFLKLGFFIINFCLKENYYFSYVIKSRIAMDFKYLVIGCGIMGSAGAMHLATSSKRVAILGPSEAMAGTDSAVPKGSHHDVTVSSRG
jgi:hypothetical protein